MSQNDFGSESNVLRHNLSKIWMRMTLKKRASEGPTTPQLLA
jgi:hypothetical protein